MARLRSPPLAGLGQPLARVVANGVEQPVARGAVVLLDHDQRLVDEPASTSSSPSQTASTASRSKLPANTPRRRNSARSSSSSSSWLQSSVARQRLLARERRSGARRPGRERVAQALGDLRRRQHADPRGGELDRQRHAVDAPADLGHRGRVVRPRARSATRRAPARSANSRTASAASQRGHAPVDLARRRAAARGSWPGSQAGQGAAGPRPARRARRSGARSCRARAAGPVADVRRHHLLGPAAPSGSPPRCSRAHRMGHQRLVGRGRRARRARRPPASRGASAVAASQRQPRLAAAARTGEGEQPVAAGEADDVAQLALAPDEAGQLERQVAAAGAGWPRDGRRRLARLERARVRISWYSRRVSSSGSSSNSGAATRAGAWNCASARWRRPVSA